MLLCIGNIFTYLPGHTSSSGATTLWTLPPIGGRSAEGKRCLHLYLFVNISPLVSQEPWQLTSERVCLQRDPNLGIYSFQWDWEVVVREHLLSSLMHKRKLKLTYVAALILGTFCDILPSIAPKDRYVYGSLSKSVLLAERC